MKLAGRLSSSTQAARSSGVETAQTPASNSGPASSNSPASFSTTFPPRENPVRKIGAADSDRSDRRKNRRSEVWPAW